MATAQDHSRSWHDSRGPQSANLGVVLLAISSKFFNRHRTKDFHLFEPRRPGHVVMPGSLLEPFRTLACGAATPCHALGTLTRMSQVRGRNYETNIRKKKGSQAQPEFHMPEAAVLLRCFPL